MKWKWEIVVEEKADISISCQMSVTHGLSGSWLKPRAQAAFSISIYMKKKIEKQQEKKLLVSFKKV